MRPPLPEPLEEVVQAVLDTAELDLISGREEVARELRSHFEDALARGATVEEAIERFGDPIEAGRRIARTRPRAQARSRGERGRWWMSMGEWTTELRRAVRRLSRAPGFTAVVVITLALGVGVNTAIFSVLNAVLLQDLPYEEPDRLVRMYEAYEEWTERVEYMRAPAIAEWRTWDEVFDGIAVLYTYREVGADLTDGGVPNRVNALRVASGYFETLGRPPLMGRTFFEEESYGPGEATSTDAPGATVTVLSHGLWTNHFGGSPDVVGSSIRLDGASFEVVGVMPASFRDPFGTQADLWVPQDMRPGGGNHFRNYYLSGVARLRDGVTIEAARDRLMALSEGFAEDEPSMQGSWPVIEPLQAEVVGETRRTMLWILAAAAALVLFTACVNVANLLFARGLQQDRALALRSALGSGRGRLIAGILIEDGLLAVLGGGLGLVVGWLGLRGLLGIAPDALPIVAEVRFGTPVFLFAFLVTCGALLAFGLTPALRMSRTEPADVLRSGDRASTAGRFVRRLRDGLVVAQVAMALVLVTGALLLTRSFNSLLDVPLGIEEQGVLTFEVHLPLARYGERESRVEFHRTLQQRVAALPGVAAVGATSWLPVNGRYHSWGFEWVREGAGDVGDDQFHPTDVRTIEGDYFAALGIEILRGDPPASVDVEAEQVVWINRNIAETYFEGVDPLEQRIQLAGAERRIAGIVEDVPFSPRGDVSPKAYVPHAQADGRNWALIQTVKASGDPGDLREAIRTALARIDGDLVLYRPATLSSKLAVIRAQDRFATFLMAAFGVLALTLSLVGTYGVLSGTVAGRTREIGIRMALGADGGSVRRMVLRYAAGLTIPGVVLGLGGAWVASRWIGALLFGVESGDPLAYGAAVLVFLGVGAVAGWLPAQRATRVDTVQVLTSE
jgi:putative ABC transport system permease protein